ncbi:NusB antitermination factor [Carnobacterium iners]|uniref:Transcription antitermination protein NusB n=1 Tax=Carnobacterium iners TaxID=1073423 RepID=A0A1X7NQX1_9LACT|nr:transcription antitermination factor NusB [Carnobacterium iners]SEL16248.1 NusB antitermination factor [Carnobacterium iners]SMH40554.1 NusB antitermination factor [Carnobacterium iners]
MSLTRREIREKALQSLFQLSANQDLAPEIAMQQALISSNDLADEVETVLVPEYLDLLVKGVIKNQLIIDEEVQKYLENWSMERLAKTDVVIMRIAIFEMLYVPDVPAKVALNEALEITKLYNDEKSRKFVNGVLANIVNNLEKKEAE